MTRSATSLVGEELREALGSLVVRETPFSHDLWQVKIQSDLISPEDDGSQVATIVNTDGTFSFRREEPGYDT